MRNQSNGWRGRLAVAAVAAMVMLALRGTAQAHVFLDHADPKVGAAVGAAPVQVKVWFTGEVEPAFSGIEVFDAGGQRVDKQDGHADPADKTAMIVSLPPLAAGTYKVVWHAVASDTHKTRGDFKFTVKS